MADFAPLAGYSRSQIDRAGTALRSWWIDDKEVEVTPALLSAFGAMISFRESFQLPLTKTVMGLRSMVRSESPELKAKDDRLPVVQA